MKKLYNNDEKEDIDININKRKTNKIGKKYKNKESDIKANAQVNI